MPIFIAALIGGLIQAAGTFVGRVLISLGVGYLMFTGLDTGLDYVRGQITASFAGYATQSLAVLSALQAGKALSVICSAFSVRLLLNGLQAGAIKKFIVK